jgi:hypothetical protein
MTRGDKLFAEGSKNAFPSTNAQGKLGAADREDSDQEDVDEETRQDIEEEVEEEDNTEPDPQHSKFKRKWGGE